MTFTLAEFFTGDFAGMCAAAKLCKAAPVRIDSKSSSRIASKHVAYPATLFEVPEPRRAIKRCTRIAAHYELGAEVQPTYHEGTRVLHARRVAGGPGVVVKVRGKPAAFRDAADEQAWRRSSECLMNLPHKAGIARLHEVLEDEGAYYVVMERCAGSDLCETIRARGPLPVEEVREILRQLLTALLALHSRGWIHKDLKLENVILDTVAADGEEAGVGSFGAPVVTIIDFDTLGPSEGHFSPGATGDAVLGTDQYIAPESYGGRYSTASDIFGLGVIAYGLLTGQLPFADSTFDYGGQDCYRGSPKMAEVQDKMRKTRIDWSAPVFARNPLARDLVQRMVAMDPNVRPSAQSALNHTWFDSVASHSQAE